MGVSKKGGDEDDNRVESDAAESVAEKDGVVRLVMPDRLDMSVIDGYVCIERVLVSVMNERDLRTEVSTRSLATCSSSRLARSRVLESLRNWSNAS
jgi:hypothetical protein